MVSGTALTWKCDVESFIWDGEIGYEAELGLEVAIETCVDGWRQFRTRESGQRLNKTPVLSDEQVVVMILQVEGVECELNSYWENKTNKLSEPIIQFKFLFNPLRLSGGNGRKWLKRKEKGNDKEHKVNLIIQMTEAGPGGDRERYPRASDGRPLKTVLI